ncbi:aldo/keto reductase [Streptomyces albipurpureus]|uniref:Aldo/keto reductase n=1 Tax=Streptomyces albipurpureus TaxID=2897419 RepID=A0ABT0UME1_9ACTN|nr:aldo/keto reductase [Streptomyces sp. CWNU-1]MCM2388568.1 aldo/keto reductase [Streptomyces sp. CWNU-1]
MDYVNLGGTGLRVSRLALGTMMFGAWGNQDHDACVEMVHAALDAGVNFIDTADVYAFGETEEILGRALKGRRDSVVLATKFGEQMNHDEPLSRGASRRWITRAVEGSLRRLGTDHIDLYQLHRPDPGTDLDETLGALTDLIRQGKVRAIGSSAFTAEQLTEGQWTAERRGRERFTVEQLAYSAFARHAEAGTLPVCQRYDLGVMVYSPLNGGWLTGKYRAGAAAPADSRAVRNAEHFDHAQEAVRDRKYALVEEIATLAADTGHTMIELAIGFVLAHPAVSSAIIGPRTMEQLTAQLGAAEVRLGPEVMDRLDALVAPGTDVNPADCPYAPPALADPALRRRDHARGVGQG